MINSQILRNFYVFETFFNIFLFSIFRVPKKKAKCTVCGDATFFECSECYCILEAENEEHNCPDDCCIAIKPVLCLACNFEKDAYEHKK